MGSRVCSCRNFVFWVQENWSKRACLSDESSCDLSFVGWWWYRRGTAHVGGMKSDGRNRALAATQKAEVRSGLLSNSVRRNQGTRSSADQHLNKGR